MKKNVRVCGLVPSRTLSSATPTIGLLLVLVVLDGCLFERCLLLFEMEEVARSAVGITPLLSFLGGPKEEKVEVGLCPRRSTGVDYTRCVR